MQKHLCWGLLALLLAIAPAVAQTRVPPSSHELIRLSFAPVVKKAAPAVVNVFARRVVHTVEGGASPLFNDPFFRRFFGDQVPFGLPRERVQNSLGSGVIIDADGLIMTNHHVIKDAQEVVVVLADRREFAARILLSDQRVDLAVLKIDNNGEKLPVLEIGDSDRLEVGDLVLAIGNPFGVGQTVTSGIVSALARTAVGVSDFRSFIQTDAAINPGNSGGALVDLDGRLVGINTAIFSQSGGSVGIGFAIPTATIRIVIQAAANGGHIVRPWLGASGQPVTSDIAASLGLPHPVGVLVKEIAAGSPAAAGGVRVGDVILEVNGHEIEDPEGLRFRIGTTAIEAPVRLALWRSGERREITTTLTAPPEQPPRELTPLQGHHPLSGATIANLNPAFADELSLDTAAKGVIIYALENGGTAQRLGIHLGDIVVSLNKHAVDTVDQLKELLKSPAPWVLAVRRGDQVLSVTVKG